MPSPVIPLRSDVIAAEQEYLFRGEGASLANPVWAEAACRDARPEAFFPISAFDHASRAEALAWCAGCAIRSGCLEVAMRDPSLVGVWGGTDENDRARLRRRRAG